jgi:hypothetical protein
MIFSVMETTSQTTRLLSQQNELVALLREAVIEFRSVAICDVADYLEERISEVLDLSTEEL